MPKTLNPLVSFSGGEYSPAMDSRVDIAGYRKACRKLRNMIPMNTGGATRRPGSQWIATGKTVAGVSTVSRMQKFQYSPGTTFMLEFCHQGVRFCSNGAQVQVSSPPAWVSGSSYPLGQFVSYSSVNYYLFNGPLNGAISNPATDTTHWVAQNAYEVPAPYLATNFTAPAYWDSDVFVLACCQINDVVYIVHPNYPVYKLTRLSDANWTMSLVAFNTPAMMDQNATDTTIAATTGGSSPPAAWIAYTFYGVGATFTASGNAYLVVKAYTSGAYFGPEVGNGYAIYFSPPVITTYTLTAAAPAWGTGHFYSRTNSVTSGGIIYACQQSHVSGTFAADLAAGLWAAVNVFTLGNVGGYYQLAYCRPSSSVAITAVASGGNWIFTAGTDALLTLIGDWEIQTYGTWTATLTLQASYDNGVNWQTVDTLTSVGDANFNITGQDLEGGIYQVVISGCTAQASQTPPRFVFTAVNQFVYNIFQITAYTSAYAVTASLITQTSYSTGATTFWSEGAWSQRRGYPQAVTVFQERMWYGYSTAQPQRIWGTQTDDLENFATVDESNATYGLVFDLNAPGRGPIQWMTAQTDLIAGLAGAEWVITSGNPQTAITATAVMALEHSANGSAPGVPGMIVGNAAFYVQRKGCAFQQMMYSVMTEKYMSQNLQLLSQHLTAARVKQFDYQQQFHNESLLWAVCGDGSLISMTYDLQSEIFAWASHSTGDDAGDKIISVQVIFGSAGNDDEVWLSVIRGGVCQIERLCPNDWQTADVGQPDLLQAVFADCSVSFTSPTSNTLTLATGTVLAGRSLCASINGMFAAQGLVPVAGQVTIPNYDPNQGDVVVIGLPINWVVQPMRLDVTAGGGQVPGLTKSISKLYLRTLNSLGGNWATRQGEVTPLPTYKTDFTLGTLTGIPHLGAWAGAVASGPVDAIGSDPANPSHIVAAGHNGTPQVQYSLDNGLTWTQVTVAGGWHFGQQATSVCCGNGYFVVTGPDDGHLFRVAYCSTSDLTAWSSVTLSSDLVYTSGGLCACCFADDIGQFCGFAGMQDTGTGYFVRSWTCTNPATWTQHTTSVIHTGFQAGGICRGAGLYVAVTYGDTWISADNGWTWTHYTSSFSGGTGVVYSPTQAQFVACNTNRSHSILTAADGHSWVEVGVSDFEGFGVCCTQGVAVAVGNNSSGVNTSVSSSDLITWVGNLLPSLLLYTSAVCPCVGGVIAGSDNSTNYVSTNTVIIPFVPSPLPFFPNVPQEIEVDVGGFMQNENDPQFIIQGNDPLPFTLLGITIKEDIGGTP